MIVVDHKYNFIIPNVDKQSVGVGEASSSKGMPGYKRNDKYAHKKLPDITDGGKRPMTPESVIQTIGETIWTATNPENKVTLVYVDSRGRITGIQSVPKNMTNNADNFTGFVQNQRAYFRPPCLPSAAHAARSTTALDVIVTDTRGGAQYSVMQNRGTNRPAPCAESS